MHIETMTLQELCDRMQALGVRTSKERLSDGIEQGVYPFAVCIHRKENRSRNRIFEIYTKKFEEWVRDKAECD